MRASDQFSTARPIVRSIAILIVAMLFVLASCATDYSQYKKFHYQPVSLVGNDPYHESKLFWLSSSSEAQSLKVTNAVGVEQKIYSGGEGYMQHVVLRGLSPGSLYFAQPIPREKPNPPKSYMPELRGFSIPEAGDQQYIYAIGRVQNLKDAVYPRALRQIARKNPEALMLFDTRLQIGWSLPGLDYFSFLLEANRIAPLLLSNEALEVFDPEADKLQVRDFGTAYIISNINITAKGLELLAERIQSLDHKPVVLMLGQGLLSVEGVDQRKLNTLEVFAAIAEQGDRYISILASGESQASYWQLNDKLDYYNLGSLEQAPNPDTFRIKGTLTWQGKSYGGENQSDASVLFEDLGFSWIYRAPTYARIILGVQEQKDEHAKLRSLGLLPKGIDAPKPNKALQIELYTPEGEHIKF